MKISETSIEGVLIADIAPIADNRGFFSRIFCTDEFSAFGANLEFVQANTAVSTTTYTLRGMHQQVAPHAEYKLVRCVAGSVFDVAVDLREGSPTYGAWVGEDLSASNRRSLLIPPGVAHGYLTLEPATELTYWTTERYAPDAAVGVRYDDSLFSIKWPAPPNVVSDQDASWPLTDSSGAQR